MDCRTGPTVARCGIAAALVLALCAAGCGGSSYVQVGSAGAPSTGISTGGTVSVQGGASTLGTLFAIGLIAGFAYESERQLEGARRLPAPPMDAARTVNEQDCSQPIADWSANLKCR